MGNSKSKSKSKSNTPVVLPVSTTTSRPQPIVWRNRDSRRFIRYWALMSVIPVAYNMMNGHTYKFGLALSGMFLLFLSMVNGGSFRSFLSSVVDAWLASICGAAFLFEVSADNNNMPLVSSVLHLLGYMLEALFVGAMTFSTLLGEDVEVR